MIELLEKFRPLEIFIYLNILPYRYISVDQLMKCYAI